MDGTTSAAGGIGATSCGMVRAAAGVEFAVVTEAEPGDEISRSLARGAFPPEYDVLLQLLRTLAPAGRRVLDLGAHVGTFSLAAAAAGYQVIAVEAAPRNAGLVRESAARNGFDRLRVVHAAISDRPGTVEFFACGPYGCVSGPDGPHAHLNLKVAATTGDDLLAGLSWESVDFIKMDVEGSEVAALRGMARLLSRADAPPIHYESNGHTLHRLGQTPRDLKALLERYGYRNYLVEPGRLVPVRARDLQPRACVDYLALKGVAPGPRDWRIDRPLARRELVEQVLEECAAANPHCRAHVARSLAGSSRSIRADRRVRAAMEALRADPSDDVRGALGSSSGPRPAHWRTWAARLWSRGRRT